MFYSIIPFCQKYTIRVECVNYRTRAIIIRGLYICFLIFHCGLCCREVSVTENLCTKQGNSLIFGSKIRGLYSRVGYNGARTVYKFLEFGSFGICCWIW
jgi:hypothetical protein